MVRLTATLGLIFLTTSTYCYADTLKPDFASGYVRDECLSQYNSPDNSIQSLQCGWTNNQKVSDNPFSALAISW